MGNYATKTEAIINLQERGYNQDFVLRNDGILCIQQNELLKPEAFQIMETYCFEGKRKPYDNYTIYAIESIENDIKGILMISFNRARKQFSDSPLAQINLDGAKITSAFLLSQQ